MVSIPNEVVSLWSQGLRPYAPFEVVHSKWIEQLKQANSVHPYNHKVPWEKKRHFIFGFHDSSFECVAESLSVEVVRGSMAELACMTAKQLWQ